MSIPSPASLVQKNKWKILIPLHNLILSGAKIFPKLLLSAVSGFGALFLQQHLCHFSSSFSSEIAKKGYALPLCPWLALYTDSIFVSKTAQWQRDSQHWQASGVSGFLTGRPVVWVPFPAGELFLGALWFAIFLCCWPDVYHMLDNKMRELHACKTKLGVY